MSAVAKWAIYCDVNKPGCWGGGGGEGMEGDPGETAGEVRAQLAASGWKRRAGKDVCPDCAAKS